MVQVFPFLSLTLWWRISQSSSEVQSIFWTVQLLLWWRVVTLHLSFNEWLFTSDSPRTWTRTRIWLWTSAVKLHSTICIPDAFSSGFKGRKRDKLQHMKLKLFQLTNTDFLQDNFETLVIFAQYFDFIWMFVWLMWMYKCILFIILHFIQVMLYVSIFKLWINVIKVSGSVDRTLQSSSVPPPLLIGLIIGQFCQLQDDHWSGFNQKHY